MICKKVENKPFLGSLSICSRFQKLVNYLFFISTVDPNDLIAHFDGHFPHNFAVIRKMMLNIQHDFIGLTAPGLTLMHNLMLNLLGLRRWGWPLRVILLDDPRPGVARVLLMLKDPDLPSIVTHGSHVNLNVLGSLLHPELGVIGARGAY